MTSWSASTGCLLANAYEHFRVKGCMILWDRVVWEKWSLPKHCFVLWIADVEQSKEANEEVITG